VWGRGPPAGKSHGIHTWRGALALACIDARQLRRLRLVCLSHTLRANGDIVDRIIRSLSGAVARTPSCAAMRAFSCEIFFSRSARSVSCNN